MSCNNDLYEGCLEKNYAVCIKYEGDLPQWSNISGYATLEDTTEELYKEIDSLKEEVKILKEELEERDRDITKEVFHITETNSFCSEQEDVNEDYLNERYPDVREGFRVFMRHLNTTFEKTSGSTWKMYNSVRVG